MSEQHDVSPRPPALRGPFSWENWRAFLADRPEDGAYEAGIYSDSWIVGAEPNELGPYQLFNPVHTTPGGPHSRDLRLAFVLRVGDYLPVDPSEEATRRLRQGTTEDELYHGGDLSDELAALLSLALGVRMKAGRNTREFQKGDDPRGSPVAWSTKGDPAIAPSTGIRMPRLDGRHELSNAVDALKAYPTLGEVDAVALVRAARSYQDGLWLADSDPHLAWLLIVTAVECVAGCWRSSSSSLTGRLRSVAYGRRLIAMLEKECGEHVVEKVAEVLAPLTAAKDTFLNFLGDFLPPPPEARAAEAFRLDWTREGMKPLLSKIYDHRSSALHTARPFPRPLCEPPIRVGDAVIERPAGLGSATPSAAWQPEDLPMYLHTFEHVARGAILRWWESRASRDSR